MAAIRWLTSYRHANKFGSSFRSKCIMDPSKHLRSHVNFDPDVIYKFLLRGGKLTKCQG